MGRPVDDNLMWKSFNNDRVNKAKEERLKEAVSSYKAGEVTKDQLIEEGIWDRAKAKVAGYGAGIGQTAKNIGQAFSGTLRGGGSAPKADPEVVRAQTQFKSIINSFLRDWGKIQTSVAKVKDASGNPLTPEIIIGANALNAINVLKKYSENGYGTEQQIPQDQQTNNIKNAAIRAKKRAANAAPTAAPAATA